MANSLLDFVMSLVRDPDAAAQYAADPAQAIADANLTNVTSADVNHLIPVVAESMSTPASSGAFSGGADNLLDSAHNVWASGAATAAFDAFDDHLPMRGGDVIADHVPTVANVIELPEDTSPTIVDRGFEGLENLDVPTIATAPAIDVPSFDDHHVVDVAADDSLDAAHHDLPHPQDPDFDMFT